MRYGRELSNYGYIETAGKYLFIINSSFGYVLFVFFPNFREYESFYSKFVSFDKGCLYFILNI